MNYMIDNVEVVIHVGANIFFNESLKEATMTNVFGTREMLRLSERFKNLQIFIYLSTAFSNCPRKIVEEKFYVPPINPETMIKIVEDLDDKSMNTFTEKVIDPWPNTYAFTKALAEELVRQYSEKMPMVVIRPSIGESTMYGLEIWIFH